MEVATASNRNSNSIQSEVLKPLYQLSELQNLQGHITVRRLLMTLFRRSSLYFNITLPGGVLIFLLYLLAVIILLLSPPGLYADTSIQTYVGILGAMGALIQGGQVLMFAIAMSRLNAALQHVEEFVPGNVCYLSAKQVSDPALGQLQWYSNLSQARKLSRFEAEKVRRYCGAFLL
jgi:hypothetical protein